MKLSTSIDEKLNSRAKPGGKPLLQVAVMGFGTVGSSVARILTEHPPAGLRLSQIYNRTVQRKKVDWVASDVLWTENFDHLLTSDVDIVVEVVGGLSPAGDWIRAALEAGKSVVTANKQLIAHHGPELFELAHQHGVHLAFGASVAGGVPVISGLQEGLAGDELFKLYGILNGTCNYILSQIENRGISFAAALAEAQKLGFAEADPTDDIDGFDARAKLAILARVGLRCNVHPTKIVSRSIAPIEAVDFDHAKQLQCTIRQVSWAQLQGNTLLAAVQPSLVGIFSPLARVEGSQNLVMSTGKFGGETVFAGHGAGGHPTAVAVVSDLIAISRAKSGSPVALAEDAELSPSVSSDFSSRHYVRFTVKDRPGIIASLASIFAGCGINLDSVLQKPGYDKTHLPFVITLEPCKASLVEDALQQIAKLDFLVKPCLHLPILD
jgi:homoserine dehydrogenase